MGDQNMAADPKGPPIPIRSEDALFRVTRKLPKDPYQYSSACRLPGDCVEYAV